MAYEVQEDRDNQVMNVQECPQCGLPNVSKGIRCIGCYARFDTTFPVKDKQAFDKKLAKILEAREGHNEEPTAASLMSTDVLTAPEDKDIEIRLGSAKLQKVLVLTGVIAGIQFHIPISELQEVLLGRKARSTQNLMAIDLTSSGGHVKGVSRRHATIRWEDNFLVIVDNKSTNGTFLNGKRIVPEQPRIVRDKDTILLGDFVLHVSFE